MKPIVILGAGKIGQMVAQFLGSSGDYSLRIGDVSEDAVRALDGRWPEATGTALSFDDPKALDALFNGAFAVISCAPFHCNPLIAERAKACGLHYLDLTEDVAVTDKVEALAGDAQTAFIPQCGLAPGFITIVSLHLMGQMEKVRDLRLRVGALPRYPDNRMKYNLTWSTSGLINEYCNPCEVVQHGELITVQPLENLEEITIDGVRYEAFNTSGGLGTLAETLKGRVANVNYKSMRYPGHNYLLKFLLHDLGMIHRRDLLEEIFEDNLPRTYMDSVVIYVSATGTYKGQNTELVYANTVNHRDISGQNWSAIQITTAAGICGVLDLLAEGKLPQKGFVRQEDVPYEAFIANRFGRYYDAS